MIYKKTKDMWDKLSVISTVSIPIAVVILGALFSSSLKSREIETQYVKLALETLQNSDSTAVAKEFQNWALTILKKYSPIPIPPKVEAQILKLPLISTYSRNGVKLNDIVVDFESYNSDLYICIDGPPQALTPSTLLIHPGLHDIVFKSQDGNIVGAKTIRVSGFRPIVVKCDPRNKKIVITRRPGQ